MSANHLRPLPPTETPAAWVGMHEGLHCLVTTYPDGRATIATRDHTWETWSAPTELVAAR